MARIFISYTETDRTWAHWIGVTLRDHGHEPFVHEWEVAAGQNIPRWMEERLAAADHVLCLFSDAYIKASFSRSERWIGFYFDPEGRRGFLIPVEVEPVSDWPRLVAPLNRLSLVGRSEVEAERALLAFLAPRGAPLSRPEFPGRVAPADPIAPGQDRAGFADRGELLPRARPPLPRQDRGAPSSGSGADTSTVITHNNKLTLVIVAVLVGGAIVSYEYVGTWRSDHPHLPAAPPPQAARDAPDVVAAARPPDLPSPVPGGSPPPASMRDEKGTGPRPPPEPSIVRSRSEQLSEIESRNTPAANRLPTKAVPTLRISVVDERLDGMLRSRLPARPELTILPRRDDGTPASRVLTVTASPREYLAAPDCGGSRWRFGWDLKWSLSAAPDKPLRSGLARGAECYGNRERDTLERDALDNAVGDLVRQLGDFI